MKTRSVEKNELPPFFVDNAAYRVACRLLDGRDDRNLLAHQAVDERRFTGVRPAYNSDYGDFRHTRILKSGNGELRNELLRFAFDALLNGGVGDIVENVGNPCSDLDHLGLLHAAGRD